MSQTLFSTGSYVFFQKKVGAGPDISGPAPMFRGRRKNKVGALFLALVPCLAASNLLKPTYVTKTTRGKY